MVNFIVHVGDGKCGSTSIQSSLYDARETLRSHGIIYETTTPKNGHFNLVSLVGRSTRGDPREAEDHAHKSIAKIREVLSTGIAKTVLLSAESFFGIGPDRLMSILHRISDQVERLDIIAYVRSPHSMYLSLVQQMLKGNSKFTSPDRYVHRIDKVLENWRNARPTDSLSVRNFDRAKLIGGDVVTDFQAILRELAHQPDLSLPPSNENTSLSAEQLVVLQEFRKVFLKERDGKAHPTSQAMIAYFEDLTELGLRGSQPALTPAALAALKRLNDPVVNALNARFSEVKLRIPGPAEDVQDDVTWNPDNKVNMILANVDEDMCDLLRNLAGRFQQRVSQDEIATLAERVRTLADRDDFDSEAVLHRTVAFWRAMKLPMRANILSGMLAPVSPSLCAPHPMILYGKEDWLFLKDDSNRVQEQIAGTYPLPESFEDRWVELFNYRAEMARKIRYRYFYGIAPNKECIHAEQLPEGVKVVEDRPVRKVLKAAEGRVDHRYYYEPLRRAAQMGEDVFVRGDTHWNHTGALLAFNEVMRGLDLPEMCLQEFEGELRQIEADLSIKLGRLCPTLVLKVRDPKFRLVDNNQVNNVGQRRIYEHEDKSLPTCVFFRDSFTSHQLEMFASRFSRIVFLWQPNIDYGIVTAEAPDVVINQQVERFLVSCPDDRHGPSHRDYEKRKLSA